MVAASLARLVALRPVKPLMLVLLAFSLSACGINKIPELDEQAKAMWAQVQNQYQRRADLIPNLVETVKGFAAQEQSVLVDVIEARASATQMRLPENLLTDPDAFQQYERAQGRIGNALGRLLVVTEKYPQLQSNQNFLALQSQLEGTENRISVARRDFIESVRVYNTEIRTFPGSIYATVFYPSAEPMQTFTATSEAQTAPQVNFGTGG